MRQHEIVPADLGINRLLAIFAALSFLVLAALGFAPARSRFTEWRSAQQQYNGLAAALGSDETEVGVHQIWRPGLGVVDRCGSCHLGAVGNEAVGENALFSKHPPIPHDPTEFGCTPCHGGQGRATTKETAHGNVAHWHEPLLPREHYEAGCGSCHTHIPVPSSKLAERGRAAFEQNACRDCHKVSGIGQDVGPDLTTAGLRDDDRAWHENHLSALEQARTVESELPWTTSFGGLTADEVRAVEAYLSTLIGAPRLMAGRTLAFGMGCRGCHIIGGVGGEDGPTLDGVGTKVLEDLDWSAIQGAHTLEHWHREHLLDPARVTEDSEMPNLGLTNDEADLLTTFVMSMRAREVPAETSPRDRIRGTRLGERDFGSDGESLFGAFCAGCHGEEGEGRRFAGMEEAYPSVTAPELLSLMNDGHLRETIAGGRPGRRMPAWGGDGGILTRSEIDVLVSHLLSRRSAPPSLESVLAASEASELGMEVYRDNCAQCHGLRGEGSPIGSPLAAPDNECTSDPERVYSIIVSGSATSNHGIYSRLTAEELGALLSLLATLPPTGGPSRSDWEMGAGNVAAGEEVFTHRCVGCHGRNGDGRSGPAIGSRSFLDVADDHFVIATVVRGRSGTTMPAFGRSSPGHPQLAAEEIADVAAYLRTGPAEETNENDEPPATDQEAREEVGGDDDDE